MSDMLISLIFKVELAC